MRLCSQSWGARAADDGHAVAVGSPREGCTGARAGRGSRARAVPRDPAVAFALDSRRGGHGASERRERVDRARARAGRHAEPDDRGRGAHGLRHRPGRAGGAFAAAGVLRRDPRGTPRRGDEHPTSSSSPMTDILNVFAADAAPPRAPPAGAGASQAAANVSAIIRAAAEAAVAASAGREKRARAPGERARARRAARRRRQRRRRRLPRGRRNPTPASTPGIPSRTRHEARRGATKTKTKRFRTRVLNPRSRR